MTTQTPNSMRSLSSLVPQLAGRTVLVVGDVTLDEYLFGQATRLSREAPVPVLEFIRRETILGAAANPARNIVAVGSQATLVGIVGDDLVGEQLHTALAQAAIASGLLTVANRATTLKTRILSHDAPRLPQQVARLDRLDHTPLAPHDEQQIVTMLEQHIPLVDAVLCSDYRLGLLSQRVVDAIRGLCKAHRRVLTVDAQGNSHRYRGVDLFRCNDTEASAALGRPLHSEADFQRGLGQLQQELGAACVIVTRGPEGFSIIGAGLPYRHIPAVGVSEVYDTIGAGDTFIAVATLALAAQIEPLAAAQLANIAAAQVVQRLGNAVVTQTELTRAAQVMEVG